jgi:transcriptional regulator with XRE-family HTH domain
MNIKERIREICQEHNINLPKLEAELGFGKGTISKWDKSAPSIDKLMKVADYFKISLDELVYTIRIYDIRPEEQRKMPKDLKKLLKSEEIALNGRLLTDEDKQKMYRIIEAAFWDAKEMNKRPLKINLHNLQATQDDDNKE